MLPVVNVIILFAVLTLLSKQPFVPCNNEALAVRYSEGKPAFDSLLSRLLAFIPTPTQESALGAAVQSAYHLLEDTGTIFVSTIETTELNLPFRRKGFPLRLVSTSMWSWCTQAKR